MKNVIKQNMGTILLAMAVVVLMGVALWMAVGEMNKTAMVQSDNVVSLENAWGGWDGITELAKQNPDVANAYGFPTKIESNPAIKQSIEEHKQSILNSDCISYFIPYGD